MFGIFDSLSDLALDAAKIATAPIEIVADTASMMVKPIADAASDVVDGVKSLKD